MSEEVHSPVPRTSSSQALFRDVPRSKDAPQNSSMLKLVTQKHVAPLEQTQREACYEFVELVQKMKTTKFTESQHLIAKQIMNQLVLPKRVPLSDDIVQPLISKCANSISIHANMFDDALEYIQRYKLLDDEQYKKLHDKVKQASPTKYTAQQLHKEVRIPTRRSQDSKPLQECTFYEKLFSTAIVSDARLAYSLAQVYRQLYQQQTPELSVPILNLCLQYNAGLPFIEKLLALEFAAKKSNPFDVLKDTDGFVAKLVGRYCRHVGAGFLNQLFEASVFPTLFAQEDTSSMEEIMQHSQNMCVAFLDALFANASCIPREVRAICCIIETLCMRNNLDLQFVAQPLMAALFMYRYIFPALLLPYIIGQTKEVMQGMKKAAILAMGILDKLTARDLYDEKDAMYPMNDLLHEYRASFDNFVQSLSHDPLGLGFSDLFTASTSANIYIGKNDVAHLIDLFAHVKYDIVAHLLESNCTSFAQDAIAHFLVSQVPEAVTAQKKPWKQSIYAQDLNAASLMADKFWQRAKQLFAHYRPIDTSALSRASFVYCTKNAKKAVIFIIAHRLYASLITNMDDCLVHIFETIQSCTELPFHIVLDMSLADMSSPMQLLIHQIVACIFTLVHSSMIKMCKGILLLQANCNAQRCIMEMLQQLLTSKRVQQLVKQVYDWRDLFPIIAAPELIQVPRLSKRMLPLTHVLYKDKKMKKRVLVKITTDSILQINSSLKKMNTEIVMRALREIHVHESKQQLVLHFSPLSYTKQEVYSLKQQGYYVPKKAFEKLEFYYSDDYARESFIHAVYSAFVQSIAVPNPQTFAVTEHKEKRDCKRIIKLTSDGLFFAKRSRIKNEIPYSSILNYSMIENKHQYIHIDYMILGDKRRCTVSLQNGSFTKFQEALDKAMEWYRSTLLMEQFIHERTSASSLMDIFFTALQNHDATPYREHAENPTSPMIYKLYKIRENLLQIFKYLYDRAIVPMPVLHQIRIDKTQVMQILREFYTSHTFGLHFQEADLACIANELTRNEDDTSWAKLVYCWTNLFTEHVWLDYNKSVASRKRAALFYK